MIQLVNLVEVRSGPGLAAPSVAEGDFEIGDLVEPEVLPDDSSAHPARELEQAVPAMAGALAMAAPGPVMVLPFPLAAEAAVVNDVEKAVPSFAGLAPAGAVEDALPPRPAHVPAEGGRLAGFLPAQDASPPARLHAPSRATSRVLDLPTSAPAPAAAIEETPAGGMGGAGMPVLPPGPPRRPVAEVSVLAASAVLATPARPQPGPDKVTVAPVSAPVEAASAQASLGERITHVVPRGGPPEISTAAFAPGLVTLAPLTATSGHPEAVEGPRPLPPEISTTAFAPSLVTLAPLTATSGHPEAVEGPRPLPPEISTAAFAPGLVTLAPLTAPSGHPEAVEGPRPLPPSTPVQMVGAVVGPEGAAIPAGPAVAVAVGGVDQRPEAARTETFPVSRQTTAEMRFHQRVLAFGARGAAGPDVAGSAPAVPSGPKILVPSADSPPDPVPSGAIPFLSPMPAGPADVPVAGHETAAPERAAREGSGAAPADAAAAADVAVLVQPAPVGPAWGEAIESVPNLGAQAIAQAPGPSPAHAPDLGPRPAAPLTPEALTRQVAERIISHAGDRAEVQLSPVELGRLRFEITQRGEGVQIFILAERGETLDLLRRNGDQLLGDLRAMGFSGSELNFGAWGRQAETDKASRAPDPEHPSETAVVPALPPSSRPLAGTDGRGLDLRL